MSVEPASDEVPMTNRRSLGRSQLTAALATAKTSTYPDVPPPSSSRGSTASPKPSLIRDIAWSPTGALVATADGRSLRVWNPERSNIRLSTELRAPSAPAAPATSLRRPAADAGALFGVTQVVWNPTREAELASVGIDGTVRFWDVRARGACVGSVDVGGDALSLAWRSPHTDADELVVGRKDDTLVTVSRSNLSVVRKQKQQVRTNGIAFSNSGNYMYLTGGDGQVRIVKYPSMDMYYALTGHTAGCNVAKQCPRGRHVAIGSSDALVTVWDTINFSCKMSLPTVNTGSVRSLSWSWDGVYLIAGGDEGGTGIQVAHVETGDIVHTIPTQGNHACPVVAWHPLRYVVAYGGGDEAGMRIVGLSNAML